MAQDIELDVPVVVDPRTTTKLKLKATVVDHAARTLAIYYACLDGEGQEIETRNVVISGPELEAWIASQEDGFTASLLAAVGGAKKKG